MTVNNDSDAAAQAAADAARRAAEEAARRLAEAAAKAAADRAAAAAKAKTTAPAPSKVFGDELSNGQGSALKQKADTALGGTSGNPLSSNAPTYSVSSLSLATSPDAQAKASINQIFQDELGRRCPNTTEILNQAKAAGARSLEDIQGWTQELVEKSPEKAALDTVGSAFHDLLGRDLDLAGERQWLDASKLPIDENFATACRAQIMASAEYQARHPAPSTGATGSTSGTGSSEGGQAAVDAMKAQLGKRTIDTPLNYFGRSEADNNCANAVCGALAAAGTFQPKSGDASVANLARDLKAAGWTEVTQAQAQPGDVVIVDGSVHTDLVESNVNGQLHSIGSDNPPDPRSPNGLAATQNITLSTRPYFLDGTHSVVILHPPESATATAPKLQPEQAIQPGAGGSSVMTVDQIQALAKQDPTAAARETAKLIEDQVDQGKSPREIAGLIIPLHDSLAAFGSALSPTRADAFDALASAASHAGATASDVVGAALADGQPNGAALSSLLGDAVHDGHGAALGLSIAKGLGAGYAGQQAFTVTQDAVKQLQIDFAAKQNTVNNLEQGVLQTLGPSVAAMTDDEKNAVFAALKTQNGAAYQALDQAAQPYVDAAADFARAANPEFAGFGNADTRSAALQSANDLGGPLSARGSADQRLQRELVVAASKEPNFLTWVGTGGSLGKDLKNDFGDRLSVALAKTVAEAKLSTSKWELGISVGTQGIPAVVQRKLDTAQKALEGLVEQAPLYGMEKSKLQDVVDLMQKLPATPEGMATASKRIDQAIEESAVGLPGSDPLASPRGLALKGLSATFGAAALFNTAGNLSAGQVKDYFRTLGDGLQAGSEAGLFVVDVLRKASPSLEFTGLEALEKTSGVGAVFTAVADGIATWDDYSKGKRADALSDWLQFSGGVITAAELVAPIPLWGQIAAGTLIAGGIAVKAVSGAFDEKLRQQNFRNLVAGIVPDADLDGLAQLSDPSAVQKLVSDGVSPEGIRELAKSSPGYVDTNLALLADFAKALPGTVNRGQPFSLVELYENLKKDQPSGGDLDTQLGLLFNQVIGKSADDTEKRDITIGYLEAIGPNTRAFLESYLHQGYDQ